MLLKEKAKLKERRVSKSGSYYYVFHFDCKKCGVDIKAQTCQLNTHSGMCRSCTQKGIPYMYIYNELKNHKNKKFEVNLSFDEFLDCISTKKCHYCNEDLIFNQHSKSSNGQYLSRAYQIDRKNNFHGYYRENIVPCCWECNRLKSDIYTYEEFMIISNSIKIIKKNRKSVQEALVN